MDKKIVLAKLEEIEMLANEWDDPQLDDFMGMVNLHHILNKTKYIQRELDSKIVMPKSFDEWFKTLNKPTQGEALSILYWIVFVFDLDTRTNEQQNLYVWISACGSKSMIMRRISKCVDAIRCGYEVSEDE